jgi:predicted small lipoprotein YifL
VILTLLSCGVKGPPAVPPGTGIPLIEKDYMVEMKPSEGQDTKESAEGQKQTKNQTQSQDK